MTNKAKMSFTRADICDADGRPVAGCGYGYCVAFACLGCGHPVLASAQIYRPGSSEDHPTTCPKCRQRYWVKYQHDNEPLELMQEWCIIHRVGGR